ncbi:MAG: helix-turn-helix domain-containing protein [Planctomycetota bacterium]|nr:MAG: helix-turn-helix domain-containing protein [Planctomycetota bacterium]
MNLEKADQPVEPRRRRPRVALIVETSLGSGRDILRGIARFLHERRIWSIYHEVRSLEDGFPPALADWMGDGIIARIPTREIGERIKRAGLPTVDVLGMVPELGLPIVHVDDEAVAGLAAEHLLSRGFRSFGFVGYGGVNWSRNRREAFSTIVRRSGARCEVLEDMSRHPAVNWEEQLDRLVQFVAGLPKPAGIMLASDQLGPAVLEACRRVPVKVPDEVAVIGVDDDDPLCAVSDPPLSSVRPDHFRVGYQAASLLDRMLNGEAPPAEPILVPPIGVTTRLSTEVLALEDRVVAEALRFIRENSCNGIKVDDVVAETGVSRSVLQRRFRDQLGRTIHDEILRIRIDAAKSMLADTDLPIAEIAERCGFRHQEYLGAVFRRKLRTTPARFRRSVREQGVA